MWQCLAPLVCVSAPWPLTPPPTPPPLPARGWRLSADSPRGVSAWLTRTQVLLDSAEQLLGQELEGGEGGEGEEGGGGG
jgi:hypothetical protein